MKARLPVALMIASFALTLTACGGTSSTASVPTPTAMTAEPTTTELDAVAALNAQISSTTKCGANNVTARAALTENVLLKSAAQERAQWMAQNAERNPSSDFEQTTWARISQSGFPAQAVAEIRVYGPNSAGALAQAIIKNADFCRKVMDATFTHIGVAHEQNAQGHYWVLDLAQPIPQATKPAS
ncbi:CAP domain-containing protein [Deinococcus maricopensis]|uniref:SCP-like extracellular n=1 Tax=Deinococcus maricopensis (strain DSM 21211 / LMG 22137 / NRRL B-23946 / LB-34) TaxID=709986 RepID=E8U4K9_DEIML|nr:CAP domain-containing protein [Deinococcus maricopensis]ADV68874.1 SCP-like extracellular [Deinococcus maricopensis DSM 21211]